VTCHIALVHALCLHTPPNSHSTLVNFSSLESWFLQSSRVHQQSTMSWVLRSTKSKVLSSSASSLSRTFPSLSGAVHRLPHNQIGALSPLTDLFHRNTSSTPLGNYLLSHFPLSISLFNASYFHPSFTFPFCFRSYHHAPSINANMSILLLITANIESSSSPLHFLNSRFIDFDESRDSCSSATLILFVLAGAWV